MSAPMVSAPVVLWEWGPITCQRVALPKRATSYSLVVIVPFTWTRASVQLLLLVFDEP